VSETPYITRFRVENFGCIQDCELKLTRLHALVGPNDSGKSTLLRALMLGQEFLPNQVSNLPTGLTLQME
jgi:AAA15 family ATPase/GTPase